MHDYYYVSGIHANYTQLSHAMVAAAQEANRTKDPQRVYRVFNAGPKERHFHVSTVTHGSVED